MGKIRLTEAELIKLIKRVINEAEENKEHILINCGDNDYDIPQELQEAACKRPIIYAKNTRGEELRDFDMRNYAIQLFCDRSTNDPYVKTTITVTDYLALNCRTNGATSTKEFYDKLTIGVTDEEEKKKIHKEQHERDKQWLKQFCAFGVKQRKSKQIRDCFSKI